MSAATLNVDRLRARYHTAAGSAEHRRLDALLQAVVGGALDRALERVGLDGGTGEVCVRELHAAVRLALARSGDAALATAWADAIATELAARIAEGGPGVVRYGSRRHALADVATCVAVGDTRRAWAWRSLGLWPPGEPDAAPALVRVLAADGAAVVPVLTAVARAGRLPALTARLDAAAWRALAAAALCAAGALDRVARAAVAAEAVPAPARPHMLRQSAIAAAVPAGTAPAAALAALVLVELDPGAVVALGDEPPGALAAVEPAGAVAAGDEPVHAEPDIEAPTETEPVAPDADTDEQAPLPERGRATTEWGGLLFALHAVAALGLRDHDTRVLLHSVALELVPAESDDPAVLAFAGLPPDGEVPSTAFDGPVAEAAFVLAVADAAAAVRAWLAGRLEIGVDELDLHELLRRRAEIVADPGWLEIHLELAQVDLDVRRAGLDLDPGHLPLLGCVVRFLYA